MKFHLVKLLLFLSLAVSFMLLLKEDISRVQDASCKEPRREWQWPMQIQCISYKACSAEAELLAAQNAAGSKAWPWDVPTDEAPFAATGRWECSTPCMRPLVLPVAHSREWPVREEGAGSTYTSGRLRDQMQLLIWNLWFQISTILVF